MRHPLGSAGFLRYICIHLRIHLCSWIQSTCLTSTRVMQCVAVNMSCSVLQFTQLPPRQTGLFWHIRICIYVYTHAHLSVSVCAGVQVPTHMVTRHECFTSTDMQHTATHILTVMYCDLPVDSNRHLTDIPSTPRNTLQLTY